MSVTAENVLHHASAVTQRKYSVRQFIATYGVPPNIAAIAWNHIILLDAYHSESIALEDLLMVLHFLKTYTNETVLSKLFNKTEITFWLKY